MMRDFYRFEGRGFGSEPHGNNYMIESEEGTVLVVSLKIGNADFILAYCRKAIADRWGVYCDNPFRRASDPGCTRTWAQHFQGGIFIFRGVRFHLIREEEWMLRPGNRQN